MENIIYEYGKSDDAWDYAEEKYGITVRRDIKSFLKKNGGKYPIKDEITVKGVTYEIRVFLSLDERNKEYYIGKPLEFFLTNTNGKIIPIAIDSGDNYYCVNNETGKVYYWSAEEDKYYQIANNLASFCKLLW